MRKNLTLALRWLIYATFFVPLVVMPSSFIFPFIVPKIILFRTLVTVMLGAYALLLVINWEAYRPKVTLTNIALGSFLLSFAISTFVGVDWYHSFWDNHERMLGLFTILHYVAYYFVASAVFTNWTEWKWALRIFLFAGSIVMMLGLVQVINPDFLLNQGSDRVISTLGNAIYVGGYGLFLVFVSYLLFIKEKDAVSRGMMVIAGIMAFGGMFYSGTRGSLLGLGVGTVVALVTYAITLKEFPLLRKVVGFAGLGLLLVVLLLYVNRHSALVTKVPALDRTFNTSVEEVKNSPRWFAWRIAWESWKDYPVFGWGPNNFFYAFNQHYNPKSLEFGYGETWFDNAHNIIMNTLAVQGAFGLITYLFIFVAAISSLVIAYRKGQIDRHLLAVGMAFLVAHLVQNTTVFENPTSYLYFMFWLAMVNQSTSMTVRSREVVQKDRTTAKQVVGGDKVLGFASVGLMGVVVFFVVFIFNVQPARANIKTLTALQELAGDPAAGIAAMKEALSFNSPHIDDIRNDIARSAISLLSADYDKMPADQSQEIFTLTHDALVENLSLHPKDIRVHLSLYPLLQIGAMLNHNALYMVEAEQYLKQALELSPHRQQLEYALATAEVQLGKNQEGIQLLQQAITDDPTIGESYWRLAYTYQTMGKPDEAKKVIASARARGVQFTPDEEAIIQQIFAATNTIK